jgi:hypothetical protein
MYDVANFITTVPVNPERSGEYMSGESQNLEFFRYERNRTFLAESIRDRLSPAEELTGNSGQSRRE